MRGGFSSPVGTSRTIDSKDNNSYRLALSIYAAKVRGEAERQKKPLKLWIFWKNLFENTIKILLYF